MAGVAVRFVRDDSWQRFGRIVVAGSPLKIFRTTAAAASTLDAIDGDGEVEPNALTERLLDGGAIHPASSAHLAGDPAGGGGHASGQQHHAFSRQDVTVVTPRLGGTVAGDGRITVDDGSQPPVRGAALRLDPNRGPAAARNAGRRLVETALIAFVDADVELLDDLGGPSWLDPLLGHFDDPLVGLVAPRVAGEPTSSIDLGTRPARIRAGTRVSYVPAAAIVVRAVAFDAVGGFDERLRVGEDVDLVWRLDEAGWRCRYEPASTVWHEPRPTLAGRLRQHAGYGTSAAPLALRHPGKLSPLHTNGWTASAWGAALCGHPVIGVGLAVGSAAALVPQLSDIPPRVSFTLALRGHVRAAVQLASAVRRVWWPIIAVAALRSRRARLIAACAIALDAAATPTDIAYGWGVWKGMARHRTLRPIVPRLTAWPARP